jgi:hypothetical protein
MKYVALLAKQSKAKVQSGNSSDEEGDSSLKMTGKELQASLRARESARQARAIDVSQGKDRVQHAIDVHLHGGNGNNENRNISKGEKASSEQRTEMKKQPQLKKKRKRADNEKEEEEEESSVEEQEDASLDTAEPIIDIDDTLDISTNTGDKKESPTVPSSADQHQSKRAKNNRDNNNKNNQQEKRNKQKSMTQAIKTMEVDTPIVNAEEEIVEPDDFFLEEAAATIPTETTTNNSNMNPRYAHKILQKKLAKETFENIKQFVNHKKHRIHRNLKVRTKRF